MSRPIIAITMGDPSGIGPEIVIRSLSHEEAYAVCRPLVSLHNDYDSLILERRVSAWQG
jgi:4-hydroxy-L-threonine phosphate dehydrogenase PdxA